MSAQDSSKTTHFGFEEVAWQDKARRVRGVFDSVAPKYDLMNDLMSGGVHRLWKAAMIDWLAPRPGMALLDVAGGSPLKALALAPYFDDLETQMAGLLDAFPGLGESRISPAEGMFSLDGWGQGVGGEPMVNGDFGGRQGRAPELDLVERTVAEAGIAGAGANFESVIARLGVEGVTHDRRFHFKAIEVHAKSSGLG